MNLPADTLVVASITRSLLNSMADWELFLVIVGAVVFCSIIGLLVTRRYCKPLRDAADAGVVAGVTAIVMTLFAFVLAFGVVSLYDQFNRATDSVAGEASDLAQLIRASRTFPKPAQERIDKAVKAYILEVRNREFRLMHGGHDDLAASVLFEKIFTAVEGYEPKTQAQVAFYGSAVASLNDAVTNRRARGTEINASLPRAFGTLIILTAIVSILTTFFVTAKHRGVEVLLVSSVAIIVGAGLLTVLLLQYPFSGSVAVSSQPFVEGALRCLVLGLSCSH
ncbi:MAG: DUF4239 domain-containing protein [Gaiellaceae bacterium]